MGSDLKWEASHRAEVQHQELSKLLCNPYRTSSIISVCICHRCVGREYPRWWRLKENFQHKFLRSAGYDISAWTIRFSFIVDDWKIVRVNQGGHVLWMHVFDEMYHRLSWYAIWRTLARYQGDLGDVEYWILGKFRVHCGKNWHISENVDLQRNRRLCMFRLYFFKIHSLPRTCGRSQILPANGLHFR